MTDPTDTTAAVSALAQLDTGPAELAAIAQVHPDLWSRIALHPNAYPDLLTWLSTVGDDSVREAVASRTAQGSVGAPPPPPPLTAPRYEVSQIAPDENTTVALARAESAIGTTTHYPSEEPDSQPDPPPADLEEAASAETPADPGAGLSAAPEIVTDTPLKPIPTHPSANTDPVAKSPRKPLSPRTRTALIGAGAGLGIIAVAVVLIITLMVVPAQKAHDAAIAVFNQAAGACQTSAQGYDDAITAAQNLAGKYLDPAAVVNAGIATAKQTTSCKVPAMAKSTRDIIAQSDAMTAATTPTTNATATLTDLVGAVATFEAVATACPAANTDLATAITSGTTAAATDPATMQQPALLDNLVKPLADAKVVAACEVPRIAATPPAIRDQTSTMQTAISKLNAVTGPLTAATSSVTASVTEKTAAAEAAKHTKVITLTDSHGNKEKVTVKLGSWVKSTDTSSEWKKYGGRDSMPLTPGSSYSQGSYSGSGTFDGTHAAYLFGSIAVQNLTTDFSAKDFGGGYTQVYMYPQLILHGIIDVWGDPSHRGMGATVQCRQYTATTPCDLADGSNPVISPDMTSNNWGPAPFVIAVDTVFTPNYPTGNPEFDGISLFLRGSTYGVTTDGDTQFQVDKNW